MRNKSKSRPDHSGNDFRNSKKDAESFRKFKLYMARFEFSELTNCDFSAVSAKRSCFIKANLSGSNFTGANLEFANFASANLTNVNFKSAVLNGANFEGAKIDGACFVHAGIGGAKKLKLSETQLREIEFALQAGRDADAAAKLARQAKQQKVLEENMPEFVVAVAKLGLDAASPEYKTFVSKFVAKKIAVSNS